MASFNPMSYFSPTSVFSISSFLPTYLVTAAEPQPEPHQSPGETSEPRLEPDESKESGESLKTKEVSFQGEDNQNSEVFLFLALLTYFSYKYNADDRLKLKLISSLKKTPRRSWRRPRPALS